MNRSATVLFAFVVAGCALLHMRAWATRDFVPIDFSPFYCAGKVVLVGQDPYRIEPLRSCELHLGKGMTLENAAAHASSITPAPLPGYDFLPLAAFSRLPFHAAKLVFGALLLGFVVATGVCLAKLSPLPLIVAIAVAYLATGYQATELGQLSPIAIALITAAAVAIKNGRSVLAAFALGCAMVQPQIAAFPIIAMLLFVPKARLPLLLFLGALGVASLKALGVQGNLEYLHILPLQSAAQLLGSGQYSLAGLLATIGVDPHIALTLGTIWSVAALAAAIAILNKHREYASASGAVIMIPAAFAALGGTYIHITQAAVALLPAVGFLRPSSRWMLPSLALGVLVFPFALVPYHAHFGVETVLVYGLALACSWLLIFFLSDPAKSRQHATIIAAGLLLYFVIMVTLWRPVVQVKDAAAINEDPRLFASTADLRYSERFNAVNLTPRYRAYYFFLRLPTWISLIMVAGASSVVFLRSDTGREIASVGSFG